MHPASAGTTGDPAVPAIDRRKVAILLAALAIGDWLLYGHDPGASAAIFFMALALGVRLANPAEVPPRRLAGATAILVVALLPLIESFGLIPFLFGAIGTAHFALVVTTSSSGPFARQVTVAARTLLTGAFQCFADLSRMAAAQDHLRARSARTAAGWIVPLGFGGVFVALFASANPLIEFWLSQIHLKEITPDIDMHRLALWSVMTVTLWPFVFAKARSLAFSTSGAAGRSPDAAAPGTLFGESAILRSLVLFNALFAVETVLDVAYLWGGLALPDGMSYAAYAHRGAYPLVLTALLAGGFVIAALKPGGRIEASPLIRALVYVWILQNVLLVVSSILRLALYVEAYSLTYLRVASFIWMLLVAAGLVLIVLRMARGHSNAWLVSSTAHVLASVLYVCCFVNFAHVIASYNVDHCRELTGEGQLLDVNYLTSLGPDVIAAIDDYRRRLPEAYRARGLLFDEDSLLSGARREHDWRQWSFRRWRLSRYLEDRPRS